MEKGTIQDGTAPSEPRRVVVVAEEGDAGQRLDRFLAARLPDMTRARLQGLIRAGNVLGASHPEEDPARRVAAGASFTVVVPPPAPAEPEGEAIALDVVYEDDDLIVIDKPAGLVVHPAAGHAKGTLVNALLAHCRASLSGIGGVARPGIVHRLDKDTSGLLVAAKSDAAHRGLAEQFAAHGADGRLHRAYQALVWGVPARRSGRIEARLGRSAANRTKIAVAKGETGRHAATLYEVRETFVGADGRPLAALMRLELETGRTHQIRVHLAHIGHPVMGDATYGAGFKTSAARLPAPAREAYERLGRQALHAAELGFEHPVTGKRLAFTSPLPDDIEALRHALAPPEIARRGRK